MTKIRIANLGDIEAYTDLLQKTYTATYVDDSIGLTAECFSKEVFLSDDTQNYLKSHLIDSDTQKTWLAFEDSKLIGSVTCIIQNDAEAELTGFYVHPEYQGRGIGKELYRLALEFAGERDLVLDIYVHNAKGVAMYKKWGWKLDTSKGDGGYFYRHWPEWPEGVRAKCMYMRLRRKAK